MAQLNFDILTGLEVPSTEEIRADLGSAIQAAFQTRPDEPLLNIEPSSPMGQVLDLIVAEIEAKNAEIAFLSNMINPNSAQGRFLDALAALYGIDRKISEPTIVTATVRGLRGTFIPYGVIAQDSNGNQFRHAAAGGVTIGASGVAETSFEAIEHGALEVAAGSLNRIVTIIAGWDSITNTAAGVVGRDEESDAELRQRMADSYAINATGYVEAIQSNLAELDGVIDCAVLENPTSETVTKFGIAIDPHSIAVSIVGGKDKAIAETIYRRKDAGCGTTGNYLVTYTDKSYKDATYAYKITRPTSTALKVNVEFFASAMTDEAIQAVKEAIVNDVLGLGENDRIGMASVVYASRFYSVVQAVVTTPVRLISIALGSGSFGQSVEIPANKEPTTSASDVTVVLGS